MKTMMSERRNQNAPANSPTRRQVIAGAAMTFGGLALGLTKLRAATGEEISRTAESIHQETVFKANRKRVYEALTDAKQFNEVTKIVAAREPAISLEKSPTVISPDAGGELAPHNGVQTNAARFLATNSSIVIGGRPLICAATEFVSAKIPSCNSTATTRQCSLKRAVWPIDSAKASTLAC
jgi:hypothetical protein